MKRKLILTLMAVSISILVSCSDTVKNSESNGESIAQDTILNKEDDSDEIEDISDDIKGTSDEIEDKSDKMEEIVEEKSEKEDYVEHYIVIKNLMESKKMTIIKDNQIELEGENGIGEKLVYRLNEEEKIVLSFNVKNTSILNDGNYNIEGTVFNNAINKLEDEEIIITSINEAIRLFIEDEKEEYITNINDIVIRITENYDLINIELTF